jgi:4-hydroxy-4-methyl-2-oxoglutarate aldolase
MHFGELIALGLQSRGCVGAIVDGGVRDIAWLERAGFPSFSTYRTPVQSIGRWQVKAWGQSVTLPGAGGSGVEVRPGDFVLADRDGALIVPADHVLEVLERAEAITRREIDIRQALQGGMSLSDAIARFGAI